MKQISRLGFWAIVGFLVVALTASSALAQGKGGGKGGGGGGGGSDPPPPPPDLPRYEWVMATTGPYGTGDPTLGGSHTSFGDMNNHGVVVGMSRTIDNEPRAYRWTVETGLQDLNDELDPDEVWFLTQAWGINDTGQITGRAALKTDASVRRAYRLTPAAEVGAYATLETLPPLGYLTSGVKINNFGDVIGFDSSDDQGSTRLLWTSLGEVIDIESPTVAANEIIVEGISDFQQVIGYTSGELAPRVILWSADAPNVIHFPLGNTQSRGISINLFGQFVGHMSLKNNGPWGAFLHDGVQLISLTPNLRKGDSAVATDINDLGDIVGGLVTDSGNKRMVFARIGTDMFDVQPQIDDFPPEYSLGFATIIPSQSPQINNQGMIAGQLVGANGQRVIVLTPKP